MPNSGTSSASTYTTKMKLTDEGRPFAKDMFDLFAALIIQMQLSDHRTFFKSYPSSFTTDEASHCLKALKFTHVVKTADPANNGYQFTRTTTTFSMGKEMTKPLLQQFIQARLIINAAEPTNKIVKDKSIYYITSKGKYMIQDFSERAHVSIQHMDQHLSTITSTHIVPLERISETDHLTFDRSNITACFKIMMTKIPLERILADDVGGLKHHHSPEEYAHTFYGYQCFEWISQFTSIVNKEEADMICGELVLYGWIAHILDKSDLSNNYYDDSILFRTSRNALYHVTERGRIVLGWAEVSTNKSIASNGSGNFDGSSAHSFHHNQKTNFYGLSPSHHDYYNRPSSISNSETDVLTSTSEDVTAQLIRLRHILQDPLLRMYFRIYLKDNFCDENINFWLDYFAMRKKKKAQHTKNGLKDMLTDCYAIYDTYLKINAPMEVNIDHALKYQIQQLVQSTFSVVSDQRTKATPFSSPAIAPPSNALLSTTTISVNSTSLSQCLNELMGLYDKVNDHLCRMMAQDSVPRFLRLEKYQTFFASHLPPINNNNNENNNNNNNKNNKNNNNKNNNNSNGSSSTSSSSEEGSIGNDTIITEEKSSTLLDSDNTTSQVTQLSIGINSLTCNGD